MLEDVKNFTKEILKDTKEIVIERFFSPMYYYFLMAWIIYNWTFVYSLLFVESTNFKKFKLDYLLSFYPTIGFWDYVHNFWYVLLGPAVSTYILIWWISIWSEKSFERFEKYKSNKRTIKRKLEYEEKYIVAKEQRKIREEESDKPEIRLIDNQEFNEWFDENNEEVSIAGVPYRASEALYYTDFESYKEALEEYRSKEEEEK
jgi:hypothetical protein